MQVPGSGSPLLFSADAAAPAGADNLSLRFNSGDSASLTRAVTTKGDTKKFTFSCWVKRAKLGASPQNLFSGSTGTDQGAYLCFPDNASNALGTAQTFTAAQRGTITALTDGATITPDFSASNNYSVTLGGNRTLANPTNLTAGQSGVILITQDGTGSRTLAYGSYFKFPGGTAPTLTTTASAIDALVYFVDSSTRITARLISDIK